MKFTRTHLLSLALIAASFVLAAALFGRLPDPVPTHWDGRGVADGFTPKPWGPFVLPFTMLGVLLLFSVLPRISPRGYQVDRSRGVYEIFQVAILAFLFLVTLLGLLAGIGAQVPMIGAVQAGLGLLFMVLGNFMGKLTKNFFVGIRTPWTLANDEVWLRTHRLSGKVFVLAGLGLLVSGFAGGGVAALTAAIAVTAGVPVLASYLFYRRLEGSPNRAPSEDPARSNPTGDMPS